MRFCRLIVASRRFSFSQLSVPFMIMRLHSLRSLARVSQLLGSMLQLRSVARSWSRKRRLGAPLALVPVSSCENKICRGSLVEGILLTWPAHRRRCRAIVVSILGRFAWRSTASLATRACHLIFRIARSFCCWKRSSLFMSLEYRTHNAGP